MPVSLQKKESAAECRSERDADRLAMPDPGPEPPQPDDYRLNIPRDEDPDRHSKNCHMAALGGYWGGVEVTVVSGGGGGGGDARWVPLGRVIG